MQGYATRLRVVSLLRTDIHSTLPRNNSIGGLQDRNTQHSRPTRLLCSHRQLRGRRIADCCTLLREPVSQPERVCVPKIRGFAHRLCSRAKGQCSFKTASNCSLGVVLRLTGRGAILLLPVPLPLRLPLPLAVRCALVLAFRLRRIVATRLVLRDRRCSARAVVILRGVLAYCSASIGGLRRHTPCPSGWFW